MTNRAGPQDSSAASPIGERRRYWRRTRGLTALLLLVWFAAGLGVHYFARDLAFSFFGWPFSFWMAAQGALIVFAVLIALHAWAMERLDEAHGLAEEE